MFQPIEIISDNNHIEYRLQESDEIVYKSMINSHVKDSGLTVQNIEFPMQLAYYINLYDNFGTTLRCGNIVNTFFTSLKGQIDNVILVVDFKGVTEVSDNFCSQYCKYLLTTKNKVITINQDINISNIFAQFVLSNIREKDDEE